MVDRSKGEILEKVILLLNFLRCFPHFIMFRCHRNRTLFQADTQLWLLKLGIRYGLKTGFIYLLSFHREFRNLFYARIGSSRYFLNIFCPKLSSLYIGTTNIGEGLFIKYGIATAIGARSIGKNCVISQQVTIGEKVTGQSPVILDNVTIQAGAIIIGNIVIGNNSIIGANATVFKDVPDNCIVYPAVSRVMNLNIFKKSDS